MKIQLILSFLVLLLISTSAMAQHMQEEVKPKISTDLRFDYIPNSDLMINFKLPQNPTNNKFLLSAGYVLQGFKYSSVIDEFNATPPFDIRGYQPRNFSSYVSYLNETSLLQQKITPIK